MWKFLMRGRVLGSELVYTGKKYNDLSLLVPRPGKPPFIKVPEPGDIVVSDRKDGTEFFREIRSVFTDLATGEPQFHCFDIGWYNPSRIKTSFLYASRRSFLFPKSDLTVKPTSKFTTIKLPPRKDYDHFAKIDPGRSDLVFTEELDNDGQRIVKPYIFMHREPNEAKTEQMVWIVKALKEYKNAT